MRILIFSDLHANWEALCALRAVEPQPDGIIFLGDAVGYGPEPKVCLTWLRHHVQFAVRGEHDLAVADRIEDDWPPGEREIALACRDYTRRMLDEGDLAYLRGLPEQQVVDLGGARFCLVHKQPVTPLSRPSSSGEGSTFDLPLPLGEGWGEGIILAGHTHLPEIRRVGQAVLVNPGSLGQPRHGSPS
ncbi:MAG: hypothetical protein A2Z04_04600, partial [Chloroflexi bacterium RBG_16_57_9]